MSNPSKTELLLGRLKRGKSITTFEAFAMWGETRLGARIYDLRQKGYYIAGETVNVSGKTFKRYRLL